MLRFLLSFVLLLALAVRADFSNSDKRNLLTALDSPQGVTILGGKYTVFNIDQYGNLDDENPIKSSSEQNKWTVQKGEAWKTTPIVGDSCIRSNLGVGKDYDGRQISLTFQVTGPGVFSFYYKTSTYSAYFSDYIIAYIDGEEAGFQAEGYDEEGTGNGDWQLKEEEDVSENFISIVVPGGPVTINEEEGDPREYLHTGEDALWQHEITFVFYKDEPYYEDYDDNGKPIGSSYVPDGPVKPIKPDKDDYDGDLDAYNEDLNVYNEEELPYYNTALANFGNCVWLDGVTWTPEEPTLDFVEEELVAYDEGIIPLVTNADELNFQVHYTTNGTIPTENSPLYNSEDGILVTRSCVIHAKMFRNSTTPYEPELMISAPVTILTSPPELTATTQEDGSVLVTANAYEGNTIRYTTNGKAPTATSSVWPGDLSLSEPTTVQALCTRPGLSASEVVSLEVTRCAPPVVTCLENGVVEPNAVFTGEGLSIEASAEEGSTLRYSLNSGVSQPYFEAVSAGDSQTIAVQAIQDGFLPSEPVVVTARKATATQEIGPGLKPGWNLVELPLALTAASIARLGEDWAVYTFDNSTGCYQKPSVLYPGEVVLLFVPKEAATTTLLGAEVGISPVPERGWNLLAPLVKPANSTLWRWNGNTFEPVAPSDFTPGEPLLIYRSR
ncbi:MAG: chitobiase/beta-hexosaminidase C-terminal domain-containing protein [Victivallales bacterium]|nr:chitobiase/beta-hexosaminidase C-terminal domain-containing protein [Victivallales bacterium]